MLINSTIIISSIALVYVLLRWISTPVVFGILR